jgi:general secretion pathway protein F
MHSASASAPLTLEELAALSDEIAALARAGVPLDRGLRALARDMPGRLSAIASDAGQRLASGASLDRIVADLGTTLPPAYQTVIAVGLRAGRLPAALEGISHTARVISQLRRSVGLALLYPLVVLSMSWVLGLFVLTRIAPLMLSMLEEFDVNIATIQATLDPLIRSAIGWGPLIPLILAAWLGRVWYRSGRVAGGMELHPILGLGAVGTLIRLQRASRRASLARLLALLIEHDVPLPEAIELASGAVGSKTIAQSGKDISQRLRRGETIREPPAGFPPFLLWSLVSGDSQPRVVRTLTRAADVYRDEVTRRSQWLTFYVPLLLTITVCGSIVFMYAMLTLGPWIAIMRRLSEPM